MVIVIVVIMVIVIEIVIVIPTGCAAMVQPCPRPGSAAPGVWGLLLATLAAAPSQKI